MSGRRLGSGGDSIVLSSDDRLREGSPIDCMTGVNSGHLDAEVPL